MVMAKYLMYIGLLGLSCCAIIAAIVCGVGVIYGLGAAVSQAEAETRQILAWCAGLGITFLSFGVLGICCFLNAQEKGIID